MTRPASDNKHPGVESLLGIEREILPQPASLRARALERARASLPRSHGPRVLSYPSKRGSARVGQAAALVAIFSAFSAAAFYAGYTRGERSSLAREVPRLMSLSAPVSVVLGGLQAPSANSSATHTNGPLPAPPANDAAGNTDAPLREPLRPAVKTETASTAPTGSIAFAEELRVLQPAQRAVTKRQYGVALTSIAEHARRFPRGQLAEEREALRIRALLGLGRRAEAQQAGADFRRRFPRSLLVKRLDAMLGARR